MRFERIGNLLKLQRRAVDVEGGDTYQEIGVRSFGNGLFVKSPVTGADIGTKRVFAIEPGDLVVSNIFGWEGAVALAAAEHAGKIGSHRFMTWTPTTPEVSIQFVKHYLLSDRGLAALRAASPGSAGRNRTLSIASFEALELPLPDFPEQQRIARHLDKISVSRLAIRRANREHATAAAALADRSVELTDAASRPFSDFSVVARHEVEVDPTESYRTLGLLNRGRGVFARTPIMGSETKYRQYFRVKAGQLIYSKLFGWEGSVAIVPPEYDGYYVSAEFPTFDLNQSLALPGYVSHVTKWSGFTAQLASSTTGMGQRRQRVNIADFQSIKVPLPDLGEQQRVVAHLNKLARVSELTEQRAKLADALLPAARNEVFSALR